MDTPFSSATGTLSTTGTSTPSRHSKSSTASTNTTPSASVTSVQQDKPTLEYPDPLLDRPLAIAIAQLYTPSRVPRGICTHSQVSRVYSTFDMRCQHCQKAHLFGWLYRCRNCDYKVCHNCRPKYVERSWESLWGVLRDEC